MESWEKAKLQTYLKEVTVSAGEDIKKVVTDFILVNGWKQVYVTGAVGSVIDNGWKQVYVTGAVGSVIDMVFTTPIQNHLPLKVVSLPVSGAGEMLSMVGEIMPREIMDPDLKDIYPDKDSPLFVHLHACIATTGGHVSGGGLKAGKAFRSLRVFILPLE